MSGSILEEECMTLPRAKMEGTSFGIDRLIGNSW